MLTVADHETYHARIAEEMERRHTVEQALVAAEKKSDELQRCAAVPDVVAINSSY